jgi:hypothetical protein
MGKRQVREQRSHDICTDVSELKEAVLALAFISGVHSRNTHPWPSPGCGLVDHAHVIGMFAGVQTAGWELSCDCSGSDLAQIRRMAALPGTSAFGGRTAVGGLSVDR